MPQVHVSEYKSHFDIPYIFHMYTNDHGLLLFSVIIATMLSHCNKITTIVVVN